MSLTLGAGLGQREFPTMMTARLNDVKLPTFALVGEILETKLKN